MSIGSQFGIPVPALANTFLAGSFNPPVSLSGPVVSYSDVHLGYVRKLINLACLINIQVNYNQSGGAAFTSIGVSSHALLTFQLLRNSQQVFTSSAQIDIPTTASVPGQFINTTQYGIYSDFVNPIELQNSDSLSVSITAESFEKSLLTPENPTTLQYNRADLVLSVSPGGVIYYTESPIKS